METLKYEALQLARSPPISFNEIHALLCDHDYLITTTLNTKPQAFLAASNQPGLLGPYSSSASSPQPQPPPSHHFSATNTSPNQPTIDQLQQQIHNLQLLTSQMSQQTSMSSTPQAFYGSRSYNNTRGGRNSRGYQRGNSRGGFTPRPRDNGGSRQFSWASTQNMVYGHCNRCGIGHLPSQCPNQQPQSRPAPQANYAAYSGPASSGTAWKPDTGASHHATPDLSSLDNSEAYYGNDSLHVGNGKTIPILHVGSSKIHSSNKIFHLTDILHVPELKQNLLSVQKFCLDNDVFFEFHSSYFVVKDESTRTTLLTGPSEQGLYSIRLPQLKSLPKVVFTAVKASSKIWHC
ncbi:putative transcription factor interactor and regulator CCHC(Zn) family [Helianthus annuus]|nr:putative transcription factor interactor and regulator CCHC(Zn) family [Helianthus annuus]